MQIETEPILHLENLRGWMTGQDCVVVGCGPSSQFRNALCNYENRWTMACNRAVEFAEPDFAVCVEPRRDKAVWDVVSRSSPFIIFSHIERPHPRCVMIGQQRDLRGWMFDDYEKRGFEGILRLPQSTFFGIAIAITLGFETIGVAGLDMTADRYGERDLNTSEKAYGELNEVAGMLGSRILNLSTDSRLQALPTGNWGDIRCK